MAVDCRTSVVEKFPTTVIMGSSPEFDMGLQTLVLADAICRKSLKPTEEVPRNGVATKFKIKGYDVRAVSRCKFDPESQLPKSFSSYIICENQGMTAMTSTDYKRLEPVPGLEPDHRVRPRLESRPDSVPGYHDGWYVALRQTFPDVWKGRPKKNELGELWEIDADFR
eukprot:GHVU01087354.1.p1 GENE.GHVU01087354.1~~GHVU01087354.1.p1  ORF type:complete len:185 (-),score=16.70 GHVU01087354.1:600-1103(-)